MPDGPDNPPPPSPRARIPPRDPKFGPDPNGPSYTPPPHTPAPLYNVTAGSLGDLYAARDGVTEPLSRGADSLEDTTIPFIRSTAPSPDELTQATPVTYMAKPGKLTLVVDD